VTVASPWPSAADVIAIHGACVAAFHVHSRATTIEMLPAPPDGPNDEGVPLTVAWHREVEGLVTLVEVELPHAALSRAENTAADAYGRDRVRAVTAQRECRKVATPRPAQRRHQM